MSGWLKHHRKTGSTDNVHLQLKSNGVDHHTLLKDDSFRRAFSNDSLDSWFIRITVSAARNLSWNGKIEDLSPYVSLDVHQRRFKSAPVHQTADPHWNHRFEITIPYAKGDCPLALSLCNFALKADKDDILGTILIKLGPYFQVAKTGFHKTDWFPLTPMKPKIDGGDLLLTIEISPPNFVRSSPLSDEKFKKLTHGVHIISNPEDPKLDIVFVHGFTGNHMSTWQTLDNTTYWPEAWLKNDIANARIITTHYEIDVKTEAYLHDKSMALIKALTSKDVELGTRKIIFIACSLGGLIVKKMLLLDQLLSDQTIGMAFFGTPHFESNLNRIIPEFLKNTSDILKEELSSENLKSLDRSIQNLVRNNHINVTNFREKNPIMRSEGNFVVVDGDACRTDYGSVVLLMSDHFSITKPIGPQDMIYRQLLSFLNDCMIEKPIEKKRTIDFEIPKTGDFDQETLFQLGYSGDIDRKEGEMRLKQAPPLTFLTRWSVEQNCYVLQFMTKERQFRNIQAIPSKGGLVVKTSEGTRMFSDLPQFIETMIKSEKIKIPIYNVDYIKSPV
eukprot:TRINITY_DN1388_c0_g1_i1.p1 TRINITY_DN1388_c0_g1~~TRINITY_DN1388_c0_g1_i1.p1  ORF type:complete len:559 (-),score=103.90 TRINITY_DN1388_c0_g1_i1:4-1680(-)